MQNSMNPMKWYEQSILFFHSLFWFQLNNLEYGRYLKEVVEILENDPEFKKKIENASLDDIKVLIESNYPS